LQGKDLFRLTRKTCLRVFTTASSLFSEVSIYRCPFCPVPKYGSYEYYGIPLR